MSRSVRLLAGVLLAVAAACSVAAGDSEPLRFGLAAGPVTLDPRFATDAASGRINRLLYRRLVEFDERFAPVPSLATWERIAPRHWRFRLGAQGREFHDGTRLTATDVVATYRSVLDPERASPLRGSIAHVSAVEAADADTVDFLLAKPDPLLPGRLGIGILPAPLIASGHPFNRRPIGSGPFALDDWPSEDRLRLRRLRDGERVEFVRVAKPTVRVLKLVRGEIDMIQNDLPSELVTWLEGRDEIRVEHARGTSFAYLGFNMEDPVTSRLAVRRAIAYALDREAIIRHLLGSAARPATGILTPDHWAGHPGLAPYAHDPERARSLLREAGYRDGAGPEIVYKTSSDPSRVRIATVIQDQLARVGIPVRLSTYDWGTFYGDVKAGNFQMYSLAWVGIKMPDIFRYVFHSESVPPAGANRGRFVDADVDRLIDEAERADSLAEQARLYREIQALVHDALVYVPLWYEDHVYAARHNVAGYRVGGDGSYDGLVDVRRVGR